MSTRHAGFDNYWNVPACPTGFIRADISLGIYRNGSRHGGRDDSLFFSDVSLLTYPLPSSFYERFSESR